MEIIIVIGIVVLAIYFKRKYDYSQLTPHQKHIKNSLEDPLYREVMQKISERGEEISQENRKNKRVSTCSILIGTLWEISGLESVEFLNMSPLPCPT